MRHFGASRVAAFGSLATGFFSGISDIDIAAWGLPPEVFFTAYGELLFIEPGIEIQLVDMGACRAEIAAAVNRDGIDILIGHNFSTKQPDDARYRG